MSVQEYVCKKHGTFERTYPFCEQVRDRIKCPGQNDGHFAKWRPSVPQIIVKDGTGAGARKFRKN